MQLVSIRELRARPRQVWEFLEHDEVVLTSNGKPMALMTRITDGDPEPMMREIRQARLRLVIDQMREEAARSGAANLTPEEIEAEIRAVRDARRAERAARRG